MNYWLMKSEPDTFGIDDLAKRPQQTEHWDGVRNYQARNYMRAMALGDQILFYHSNCAIPGIVGIAEVVRTAYPDFTSWNPESKYFDPKSTQDSPLWFMVDVKLVRKLGRTLSLGELKTHPSLEDMPLLRKGSRLSVLPVTAAQWSYMLMLEHE